MYLFVYTFMNLGVWAVLILLRREDIQGEDIESFRGLLAKRPAVAVLMLLFLLSLAGIPPMGGFIAKYFVFGAVIQAAFASTGSQATLLVVLVVVGALNAVVSLFYYLRIVVLMFFEQDPVPARLAFSAGLVITLVVTGLLTVLTGIYPQPLIDLAQEPLQRFCRKVWQEWDPTGPTACRWLLPAALISSTGGSQSPVRKRRGGQRTLGHILVRDQCRRNPGTWRRK